MLEINGEKWTVSYVRGGEVVELERLERPAYITLYLKDGAWEVSAEGIELTNKVVSDLSRIFQINLVHTVPFL